MIFAEWEFVVLMTNCYDRPRDEQAGVAEGSGVALW